VSREKSVLKILGRANSFNVRKVLWICDELNIPFEREDWGRGYMPTSTAEFLRINPIGLVPAVIDDGVVLRESNSIVRYLATRHGPDEIYPKDPAQRAHVEQWMDWANYETSISLRGAFLGGMLHEAPWNNPWFIEQGRKWASSTIISIAAGLLCAARPSPSPTFPSASWSIAGSASTSNGRTTAPSLPTTTSSPSVRPIGVTCVTACRDLRRRLAKEHEKTSHEL
jgi:glutathione S-transferase